MLTPEAFTDEFAEELRRAQPDWEVTVAAELELKVVGSDGKDSVSYLHNAYDAYRQDPSQKEAVIRDFIDATADMSTAASEAIDRNRIVPIMKDRGWIEETRQAMLARGAEDMRELVVEEFNNELVIIYAQDSPRSIRYLSPDDLETEGFERRDLRAIACENLRNLLPEIERQGGDGVYMLTAGGVYESSLLLVDSIWTRNQLVVQGDIVVAIPTRDVLLVTGSKDQEGLQRVKEATRKAYEEGSYRLTPKLFVYRQGKFEVWEQ